MGAPAHTDPCTVELVSKVADTIFVMVVVIVEKSLLLKKSLKRKLVVVAVAIVVVAATMLVIRDSFMVRVSHPYTRMRRD